MNTVDPQKISLVRCPNCPNAFPVKAIVRTLSPDLQEVGIECPQCHYWVRSYYTNPDLEKIREKVTKKSETLKVLKDYRERAKLLQEMADLRHKIRIGHDELQKRMEQHGNAAN